MSFLASLGLLANTWDTVNGRDPKTPVQKSYGRFRAMQVATAYGEDGMIHKEREQRPLHCGEREAPLWRVRGRPNAQAGWCVRDI